MSNNPIADRCDTLWSKIIKYNNGGKCEFCSQPGTESHHVVGRGNKTLRYDLRNGCSLCVGHHRNFRKSAEGSPEWFMKKFKLVRPDDYAYLMIKKNEITLYWYEDYEIIQELLREHLKKLEEKQNA